MNPLNKTINRAVIKVVKNTSKLELAVDFLIEKFKEGCPPKEELLKIVQQKNQLQEGLQQVLDVFNTVQQAADITNNTVTTIQVAVSIIKSIPAPTAVIPTSGGVGIPINVITKLSDSLDALAIVLREAKAAVNAVRPAAQTITGVVDKAITNLSKLDFLVTGCIDELAQTGGEDGGEMTQQEKNNLIQEVNNSAATSGTFSNAALNSAGEEALISQLSANSSDPYRYAKPGFSTKDWQFVLEENAANTLSLPQRRIKASNINFSNQTNPFIGYVVYNSRYAKTYSYTTSVKTLVSETKQVIDSLNRNWAELNNEQYTPPEEGEGSSGQRTLIIPEELLKIPVTSTQPKFVFGNIEKTQTNQKLELVISTGYKNTSNLGNEYRVTVSSIKSGSTEAPRVKSYFIRDKTPAIQSVFLFTEGEPSLGDYNVVISIEDIKFGTSVDNASVQLRTKFV
jgi:hypothetical protein